MAKDAKDANGTNGGDGVKKRQRSPNYPAIGLRGAVEKVRALYHADGKPGSPMETALRHFGYSRGHGQALAVLSAIKKFGLVEDRNGRIVPTPLAINILEFGEDHQRHKDGLHEAALRPEVYSNLVERYREHGRLPSDDALRPELVTDEGFNPNAVTGFLADFRDTLEYAGLLEENTLKLSSVAVAEEDSGLENPESGPKKDNPPGDEKCPPRRRSVQLGIKEDVFTLDEGQVVLQWPEKLSKESFEDFESWLQLVIRKAKRSIQKEEMPVEND